METKMLRWTVGVTRMNRIRNDATRQKFGVAPIADKMSDARLRWYGHVLFGKEDSVVGYILNIFAVLAPIGPLRKVQEKAGDYSHDVLRFLMFTADAKPAPTAESSQNNNDGDDSSSAEESCGDKKENETKPESSTSLSITTDESGVDTNEPEVEKPLLRRRTRQAAGADNVEMFDKTLEEERKRKEERMKAERRMKKDKHSDLSSDDEIAVEMEDDADTPDSDEPEVKNPWEKKYPIDDKEALSMEHHKKNLESSSSSSTTSSSDESGSSSSIDDGDRSVEVEGTSVTAADALNDANSLRLGMGDFVFYSVLVGQAATTGNVGATIAAALGVVYGLLITLTYFSNGDETTPALPISIVLGTVFHFLYLAAEPYAMYYTDMAVHYVLD
ncbi:unnamed protein product [Heligmosomoides polygyrus]|uniref:SSD domain-containing protein n=1 Tax=Heligmosomoides polygyrus TaxID=6339 RepID=A0A3P8D3F0_HELPZ|nr:unnamed protein product [Heligmosomoides polygyrus]